MNHIDPPHELNSCSAYAFFTHVWQGNSMQGQHKTLCPTIQRFLSEVATKI
jgi:hypothetical protein